eukprot:3460609-Pyramimonas_sp.AAC.1
MACEHENRRGFAQPDDAVLGSPARNDEKKPHMYGIGLWVSHSGVGSLNSSGKDKQPSQTSELWVGEAVKRAHHSPKSSQGPPPPVLLLQDSSGQLDE